MRPSRLISFVLGISLLAIAALPLAAVAQCGNPGITGGGSVTEYVSNEGPATFPANLGLDRFILQRFNQARWMAARWLAASRLAGARASFLPAHAGRVR